MFQVAATGIIEERKNIDAPQAFEQIDAPRTRYEFKTVSEGAPTCEVVQSQDVDFTLVTQLSESRYVVYASWDHTVLPISTEYIS